MYLRGLGIGIVVTALLMGLSVSRKPTMTDEEIKAKAAALGMVEQESVLKPVVSEEKPKETEPVAETVQEPQKEEEQTAEEPKAEEPKAEEPKAEEVQEAQKEEEPKAEAVQETKKEVKQTGTFTLEVAGGYDSGKVCALLEKGGAIASAADFDKYLCDHGYDHKIRTGKFTIAAGSDYETIAKIITGR